MLVETLKIGAVNDSTCSQASYKRGAGQKVIGFSFYGNPNSTKSKERKYFQGIMENLSLLPIHYPGWVIRVYYDLEKVKIALAIDLQKKHNVWLSIDCSRKIEIFYSEI